MQSMKKKQTKTNEGTSHHMMFWTPEYSTCYKAPLLKKKKKKKKRTKETKKESEINMGTGKDSCMYVYFFVRFCKNSKIKLLSIRYCRELDQ